MLDQTNAYRAAITADYRKILLRAVINISDPDMEFDPSVISGAAAWSKPADTHDKVMTLDDRYATLERGRWLLDGSFRAVPDAPQMITGQVGAVGSELSDDSGLFSPAVYFEQRFHGVDVLQACSLFFPSDPFDGVPEDFTVEVCQGGMVYYAQSFSGNVETMVSLSGFTINNPDAIRIAVTKWSRPGRRMRIVEIIPGIYEEWTASMVAELSVTNQGDVSCMSLPYGTCRMKVNNIDRRFEPRNKTGIFASIEERQEIPVEIGVRLPDGTVDYKRVGVFFQSGDGWKTSNNDVAIQWDLIDIIGLLSSRTFIPPDPLPTTLAGWLAAVVSTLGTKFRDYYHVDPGYADLPVTANSASDVAGKKCGDIIRWACQATGTWPRADSRTGYLTAEPLWSQGNKVTLRGILTYPTMKANADIAMLIFKLHDGKETQVIIPGTSISAGDSKAIDNPFIHTREQALQAARLILATYGGNQLTTSGRGNPASEIGDVDTVELDESTATTGRRVFQTFNLTNSVLQNCQSRLLQANGAFLYRECALLTDDCLWTSPDGVTDLFIALGQGGQGGSRGHDGYSGGYDLLLNQTNPSPGEQGQDGSGGMIWYGAIRINPNQQFAVHIGRGGAPSDVYDVPGQVGQHTTFGPYTSAAGVVFEPSYTDILNGDCYGRSGVPAPAAGSADGAAGGAGGEAGTGYWKTDKDGYREYTELKPPGRGKAAIPGASGFALIMWDKVVES